MTDNDAMGVAAPALSGALLHVRDRLADVRRPSGDLASLEHEGLHLRIVHQRLLELAYRVQSSAEESKPMVFVAAPPIMVTRTVTFFAPCLRARSHPDLLLQIIPLDARVGVIVTNETMAILALPNARWLLAG